MLLMQGQLLSARQARSRWAMRAELQHLKKKNYNLLILLMALKSHKLLKKQKSTDADSADYSIELPRSYGKFIIFDS